MLEEDTNDNNASEESVILPVLPLRSLVVFPFMVIPLFVGRDESIAALEVASNDCKKILLLTQKDSSVEQPQEKDLYSVGTIATLVQVLKQEDGTVKVLVEGLTRAKVHSLDNDDGYLSASVSALSHVDGEVNEAKQDVLLRSVMAGFESLVKFNRKIPSELLASLAQISDPGRLADNISAHLTGQIEARQELLEATDVIQRLTLLQTVLAKEEEIWRVEEDLKVKVKDQIEKSQRLYYLREKQGVVSDLIQKIEGGETGDEFEQLRVKIEKSGMHAAAKKAALSELDKFKKMPAMSAEATVSRNYLDCLLNIPWKKRSKVSHDLGRAQKQLDKDHYGLEEVKDRVLEYMAVQGRVKKLKGPILCLVGPPGVGKTSLGRSIAAATGREFVRFALGGVHDEAEIRGHRRTYVGAMPGKIMQLISRSGVKNPLCMLDEVDKMSSDFRGDPASALLEVLDQEQNHSFNDHYLEVNYDLSDVMFVATANSLTNIPPPLLDRMEVIRIAGYTEAEKLSIAQRYLQPIQRDNCGLKSEEIEITEDAIRDIIRYYTREAGVRSLERQIAKICRKAVKQLDTPCVDGEKPAADDATDKTVFVGSILSEHIEAYLGVKKHRFGVANTDNRIGQVNGLAWTEVGGDLLTIEAQVYHGKGKLHQTGSLGDVMQESIQAALTVIRSRADRLSLDVNYFHENDFHVHVPEGATPKDGPSAGIGMSTALLSAITDIPVRSDVAMTGEITLRGEVLPIGGLKEKLLAALRAGIKTVLIPKDNEAELVELPSIIKKGLTIHAVQWIDEVFNVALERLPDSWCDDLPDNIKSMMHAKVTHRRDRSDLL